MAKRKPGYWAQYYREHREKRLAASKRYGADHRDGRREYLRAYYLANKHRWGKRTPEQKAKVNAKRRAIYKSDPTVRERAKRDAREWGRANPRKRLDARMRKYGISAAEFDRLFEAQRGACGICQRRDGGDRRGYRLSVDHCHRTGAVRGLLCAKCNKAIGLLGDDPKIVARAGLYLRIRVGGAPPNQ